MNKEDQKTKADLRELANLAISLGASDAKAISPEEIVVEDRLAGLCKEPRCESYGLSMSCPPHVSGPSGFRSMQKDYEYALVIRLIVPSASLFSAERREIGRLLHEIVASVELAAKVRGYASSRAFAGGSCKKIFCHDKAECNILSGKGECRNPQIARPSMSGFGINVSGLMKTCGWPITINPEKAGTGQGSMTWLAGLVML